MITKERLEKIFHPQHITLEDIYEELPPINGRKLTSDPRYSFGWKTKNDEPASIKLDYPVSINKSPIIELNFNLNR